MGTFAKVTSSSQAPDLSSNRVVVFLCINPLAHQRTSASLRHVTVVHVRRPLSRKGRPLGPDPGTPPADKCGRRRCRSAVLRERQPLHRWERSPGARAAGRNGQQVRSGFRSCPELHIQAAALILSGYVPNGVVATAKVPKNVLGQQSLLGIRNQCDERLIQCSRDSQ